ncbi:AraC family transcriptional regulator [Vibrio rumoiensis]|uniref:AraC family transcriptional regulator n=1 Tax=Vibrio rumoiensis TaxID=76258 RepID=UPI000B5C4361|nr:AraC family transcriptional regulator [Vibrio rumoiensis]
MHKVCEYIYQNIDNTLTYEALSQVAHFSSFHFHRQFSAIFGMSTTTFIMKVRLKRAAYQLVFQPHKSITDIALDASFDYLESFSRAFKRHFNQSPSQFRRDPTWPDWYEQFDSKVGIKMKDINNHALLDEISVKNLETILVAVKEHSGSPSLLNNTIGQFIDWRKNTMHSPVDSSRTFGIVYNDPNNTPAEQFRFDVCGEVQQMVGQNPFGIVDKSIEGGRYACLRHIGPHYLMDDKIYFIFGQWLPQSGEELRDQPMFFEYKNVFPEVAEHELITDIYVPLKD